MWMYILYLVFQCELLENTCKLDTGCSTVFCGGRKEYGGGSITSGSWVHWRKDWSSVIFSKDKTLKFIDFTHENTDRHNRVLIQSLRVSQRALSSDKNRGWHHIKCRQINKKMTSTYKSNKDDTLIILVTTKFTIHKTVSIRACRCPMYGPLL